MSSTALKRESWASGALIEPTGVGRNAPVVIAAKVLPTVAAVVLASAAAADAFGTVASATSAKPRTERTNVAVGWMLLAYTSLLVCSRVYFSGSHYLYDLLWGCNTSLLLAAAGLVTQRPLLVGAAMCIVAVDQLCWYVDLVLYMFTGKFVVGVAKYLVQPSTTRVHFATSFHHLWFLPLCAWGLRSDGMPSLSFAFSVGITTVLVTAARLLSPFAVRDKSGNVLYFNINLSYEFWRDVKLPVVHWLNHRRPVVYLPWIVALCNFVLNPLPVALAYAVANAVHAATSPDSAR